MSATIASLPEYEDQTAPLAASIEALAALTKRLSDSVQADDAEASDAPTAATPEFEAFLRKIKKEFTKTPSVIEVYLRLGIEVGNVEHKRLLREARVTLELSPNVDAFPPNKIAPSQQVSPLTPRVAAAKPSNLRPKITRRTDRQKAEAKLRSQNESRKEIETLHNNDLAPIALEATLFVLNDVIYVAKLDASEKYHVLTVIPLTEHGFSVNHCTAAKFDVRSKVFDFACGVRLPSEGDTRSLFLLLREVYYVYSPPKIFGAPLEDILEREGNTDGVPLCIRALGDYLSVDDNVKVEGIYRKNGSVNKINGLAHILDQMPDTFTAFSDFAVADVASTFKKFFTEMPEPLFGSELLDQLITIPKGPTQQDDIKALLHQMKPAYFKLAKFLLRVLRKPAEFQDITKMDYKNLSVCIGPAIMRMSGNEADFEEIKRVGLRNDFLENLLEHYDFYFADEPAA